MNTNVHREGRNRQSRTGVIRVHIERVVFDGFNMPRAELERVASEFAHQLEQQFAGVEFSRLQSIALPLAICPPVTVPGDGSRLIAARRMAATVASRLSAVAGGRSPFPSDGGANVPRGSTRNDTKPQAKIQT
jgi:hypothetical protein